ncbi:MAG: ATP-grasp domain-containing protein [Candidatus Lokiarchaeota archaeon]|nr:ATP-grasp domain-containing protein [Candidatus Lokiarchaeota archaeon]
MRPNVSLVQPRMTGTGTEIVCIGFNTRPIAQKLAEAGYTLVVVDYFGDLDIRPHVTEGHYFLDESIEPKDPEHFKAWALATLDRLARDRGPGRCLILPGSGFDDEPDAWKQFAGLGRVLGSSPLAVSMARDLGVISTLFRGTACPFRVPDTRRVNIDSATVPKAAAREVGDKLAFPVLAKRSRTAGGAGIDLVTRASALEQVFQRAKDGLRGTSGARGVAAAPVSINIQEFVGGPGAIDASVLALNDRVVCKTMQLIGDETVHAPKRFSYCGNSIPFDTRDARLDHAIEALVTSLHRRFGLVGLYGFDMVLARGTANLVEINPRVPGSTELASIAVGRNLVADHVAAFLAPEHLPSRYVATRHAIKQILFAPRDFIMPKLDELIVSGELHDITPPGTRLVAGMPILTCIHHGALDDAAAIDATARQDVKSIYAFIERDRP